MAFTLFEDDLNIIQKLDDEPNDVGGLTAAELKAKFDEGPKAIQKYINEVLIPRVQGGTEIVTLPAGRASNLPGADDGWTYLNGAYQCTVKVEGVTAQTPVIFASLYLEGKSEEEAKTMAVRYYGNVIDAVQSDGTLTFRFRQKPLVELSIAVTFV
jgi:hypothetical protein